MIGRRNLGARMFNVSTMLSDLLSSPDGKQVVVQLVNFSDYPVESVTCTCSAISSMPGSTRRKVASGHWKFTRTKKASAWTSTRLPSPRLCG